MSGDFMHYAGSELRRKNYLSNTVKVILAQNHAVIEKTERIRKKRISVFLRNNGMYIGQKNTDNKSGIVEHTKRTGELGSVPFIRS